MTLPVSAKLRRVLSFFYTRDPSENEAHFNMLVERVAFALDAVGRLNHVLVNKLNKRLLRVVKYISCGDMYHLVSEVTQLYAIFTFLENSADITNYDDAVKLYKRYQELLRPFKNDAIFLTGANYNASAIRYRDLLDKALLYNKARSFERSLKKLNKPCIRKLGLVLTVDGYATAKFIKALEAQGAERLFSYYWYVPKALLFLCPKTDLPRKVTDAVLADRTPKQYIPISDHKYMGNNMYAWVVLHKTVQFDERDLFKVKDWGLFKGQKFNERLKGGVAV